MWNSAFATAKSYVGFTIRPYRTLWIRRGMQTGVGTETKDKNITGGTKSFIKSKKRFKGNKMDSHCTFTDGAGRKSTLQASNPSTFMSQWPFDFYADTQNGGHVLFYVRLGYVCFYVNLAVRLLWLWINVLSTHHEPAALTLVIGPSCCGRMLCLPIGEMKKINNYVHI